MNQVETALKNQREFAFSKQEFEYLSGLAHKRTGIVLAEHKKDMVYSRLARRLRALNLESFASYCEFLQTSEGEEEMANLVNAITTNLTSFFREGHHFEHLRDALLLPLAASSAPKHLRIWSSACSAGMEPYSIAMTAKHAIRDLAKWDAKILATDIDSNMLEVGKQGEYPMSEFEKIPAQYRQYTQNLVKTNTMQITDDVKKYVAFRHLNLLEFWPMKGAFDAIFCRNVVIYFDKPTKQKLFTRMAEIIKPGGFLYIGHSENLNGVSDKFQLVGRTIYKRV